MKTIPISELAELKADSASLQSAPCISCIYDGFRYHVWLTSQTAPFTIATRALFKNPLEWKRGDRTLKLDPDAKKNQPLVAAMLQDAQRLVDEWREREEAAERDEQRKRQEAIAAHRVKDAAPELLAALIACVSDLARYAPNSAGSIAARAAIAKAVQP